MLFSSPIFSQASGSVAGLTFAHGRAGMTVRARSTPTNPNTARQRTIRHALARLSPYWGQLLTQDERDAWNLYGSNVVMTNNLGQPFHLTGQNHFQRANIPRIQSGISVLETAPTVFDLGTFTSPVLTGVSSNAQRFVITFDNTDDWANGVGGFMLAYCGRPTGPGQEFYAGPWRYGDKAVGDPVPPGVTLNVDTQWPVATDQICLAQIRIIQIDGRLSLPVVLGPVTVTPIV